MTFNISVERSLDGHTAMQRDVALLVEAEAGRPGCRVYDWERPWITLGRFQSPDRDLCFGCEVPWVIRPTGGKAVLHGHDLTVGLAIPLDGPRGPRSVRAAYRLITAPIVAALRACGLPATLAEHTSFVGKGPSSADCFAGNSPNDIVHERSGQKLCGCALRVTRGAALLQASVPVTRPRVDPASVIRGGYSAPLVQWEWRRFPAEIENALTDGRQVLDLVDQSAAGTAALGRDRYPDAPA